MAILPVDKDQSIWLKQALRDHLGLGDRIPAPPFIRIIQGEVILGSSGGGQEIVVDDTKRIRLPQDLFQMLGLGEGSMVAFIEREGNPLAIKKIDETVEKEGERARIVDLETTYKIRRTAVANPMPETSTLSDNCPEKSRARLERIQEWRSGVPGVGLLQNHRAGEANVFLESPEILLQHTHTSGQEKTTKCESIQWS